MSELWSLHELAIKAAPLILIAVGLSVAYRSNNWNIGAEGQFIAGALMGSIPPILFPEWQSVLTLPLMLVLGLIGGALFGAIPALLKVRFNTNEILTSLMLVYVMQLFLDWMVRGPWRNPEGNNFPETRRFNPSAVLPEMCPASGRANWGIVFAIIAAIAVWYMLTRTKRGFDIKVQGASPRAARFAGVDASRMVFFAFMVSGALAGLAGILEVSGAIGQLRPSISPGYGFTAIIVAFLGRLNPLGIIAAGSGTGVDLSWRRGGADFARSVRQAGAGLSGHVAVLRARLRHADPLPDRVRPATGGRGRERMDMMQSILLTIATAATPLLIAAIGELVVERSGVLNLGVEGMMVMGAVVGFAVSLSTGSPWLGVIAAIIAGALVFAAVRISDSDTGDQPGGDGSGADFGRAWPVRPHWRVVRRPSRRAAAATSIFRC